MSLPLGIENGSIALCLLICFTVSGGTRFGSAEVVVEWCQPSLVCVNGVDCAISLLNFSMVMQTHKTCVYLTVYPVDGPL